MAMFVTRNSLQPSQIARCPANAAATRSVSRNTTSTWPDSTRVSAPVYVSIYLCSRLPSPRLRLSVGKGRLEAARCSGVFPQSLGRTADCNRMHCAPAVRSRSFVAGRHLYNSNPNPVGNVGGAEVSHYLLTFRKPHACVSTFEMRLRYQMTEMHCKQGDRGPKETTTCTIYNGN